MAVDSHVAVRGSPSKSRATSAACALLPPLPPADDGAGNITTPTWCSATAGPQRLPRG